MVEPGPGEVRVRLTLSGINPGDVKKRQGWRGSPMPYPRVVPHRDGAGVIDAVGRGVDRARIGARVWVYGAQSYRSMGTAAEATVVPDEQAVDLPDNVPDEVGAALGIPGITAHRAVFADGPVEGLTVLVHGERGAVGSIAAQLERAAGAIVIVASRGATAVDIREQAPLGIDRIIDVSFAANIDVNAQVVAPGAVIASYSSAEEHPPIPYWPLAFQNVTLRLLGSDDFPPDVKRAAALDLTAAAAAGQLVIRIAEPFPLADVVAAHEAVESGSRDGRVLLSLPS